MRGTHQLEMPAMSYANWLAYCSACTAVTGPDCSLMSPASLRIEILIADHAVRAGVVFG